VQEQPDGGEHARRRDGRLAYVDQSRDALDDDKTVWEEISDGLDIITVGKLRDANSRAYVSRFNFKGSDQQKRIGDLSGGERNRVHLAKLLKQGATCCCSTNRPTTSTSRPCARWRRRCWPSPAAPW
jgi:sulfate-transporting ATPase